ncbi:MAG: CRISPR-associated helicase Cas3' [Vicinamibacterales bacterium]
MGLDPRRLWAKGQRYDEALRPSMHLLCHLQDVTESATRIVEATADTQLSALGLNAKNDYRERFRRCVLLAAAIHDIGKANDHFQGMILGTRDVQQNPQGLRHEWVAVLLLKELRSWLLPALGGSETDFAITEWAIAGHHPAYNHDSPPRSCPPGAGAEMRVHTDHADFAAILGWLRNRFDLAAEPPFVSHAVRPLVGAGNAFSELAAWSKAAQRTWEEKLKKSAERRLVAAVKNCLIAADVAGSALPREVPDESKRWASIDQAFNRIPTSDDLQFLAEYGLDGHAPREFQTAVANHPDSVVFVKAGCGTGKTVAAYLRAAKHYVGRRLYFCYPTTGTATEGYKDYLFPETPKDGAFDTPKDAADRQRLAEVSADLFHSRRGVDFEMILGTGHDSTTADADAFAKADALESWSTPVVACTVDTVLGLVQNNRRGLFAWPALAQSAFVFDEIHAYDDRLFGAMLRFLRDLPGLPVLLMTASLPVPRVEALREVLSKYRGLDLSPITGPESFETRPRYHKASPSDGDPLPLIVEEVRAGGRVLWVSNTVKRVMESATRAEGAGMRPLVYHSRFKYADRVRRHQAVVGAFKPGQGKGVLAVTSQVCEMSLDLQGCTLLVTECAPVPALIQRLGRLNRQAKDGDPTRPFVVLPHAAHNYLPYAPRDMEAAADWLAKLPDANISQRHLAQAWEQTAENPPDMVASAWLDGGPVTTVSELREASPGITVIVQDDVERAAGRHWSKYTLPMPPPPKRLDWRSWPKPRGIPIAPTDTIVYDPNRGAEWRP